MSGKRIRQAGLVMVFSWLAFTAFSQNLARHHWYFGNGHGIRFNRVTDSAVYFTHPNNLGFGGGAVATNLVNADLLFYTNGVQVFDVTNTQMPNGFGLTANTSGNQHAVICPVPGQPTQFYIFTNNANVTVGGSVNASIVDFTLFGNSAFPGPPIGDVSTKNQTIGLAAGTRSEAMLTVPHANGTDYWLITHQNNSDTYTVTQVQPAGAFTHTDFINLTGGLDISAANFAYDSLTGNIAVTPQTADRNVILLNFDNATGGLTFVDFVFNSAHNTAQAIYDTEWSSNSRFLYISRLNDSGTDAQVLQYDILNPLTTLAPVLPSNVFRSYGLQLAPDSAMYHLYEESAGVFRIGKLTNTDSVASRIAHTPVAFAANPDVDAQQFPSFSPQLNVALSVSFISSGTCSNSPVSFYPTVVPAADSLVWNFGDGNSSNDWSPIHTYANGGTFPVTVTAFLNGQQAIGNGSVILTQFDLQLSLVQDTTACECELPVNNGIPPCPNDTSDDFSVTVTIQGGTPTSTIWSNGDIGATLTPDSAGYYYVVVTDATGCTAYAGVNIREYDAQDQRANVWYFGQNAGIDFNTPPGTTAITGPLNSPEGVSVISDRNGNVILSTDGVRVFDRNDNEIIIPVPPGIGGENGSSQSALIVPVPGDETLFYIFTTQEVHGTNTYELRYSLYDIKLNSGDGGLVQFNQLLFSRSTERITGNGNWLIAHEYGNNAFRAYPITATGIGNPVITSIGSNHTVTDEAHGQGYMKLGGQNRLAVAFSTTGVSNVIEVFDFDNATGILSNFRTLDLNVATGQVYGLEFIGQKLFATVSGTPNSFLLEAYFDYLNNPVLINPPGPAISAELGAIQLGPDGQVYVAVNNSNSLGLITVNADTLLTSGFVLSGFALAGGSQSKLGLPNFIQNVGTQTPPATMLVTGFCLGSPTFFTGSGTDPIDEFLWSFGDGFGADSAIVQHTYAAPGNYVVTLRVFNRCGLDTLLTQNITIFPPPANPTFLPAGVPQPVICNGPLTLEAEPAPGTAGYIYSWSTGENTRSIVVNVQSVVSVTITDNNSGCLSTGTILVADNRPQVELGQNQTLCENTVVFPLDASNPNMRYVWTINGAPAGTAQTQPVDSSVPGSFEYILEIIDDLDPIFSSGCRARDTITYVFNESPVFTAVPSNTIACGTNTGQIALTLNTPATTLFSYFVTGPSTSLSGVDQPAGPVLPVFTGLAAGTYGVTVTDQISSCTSIATVGISDNVIAITSTLAQTPTCNPVALDVQTSGIISFVGATYTITDSGTGTIVIAATPFGAVNFSTLPVPVPGNYTVQVNAQGCIATRNLSVVSDPQVPVTLSSNPCTNPITVTAVGGTGYAWTGPNITSSTAIATITATPPQGPQSYTVTVTAPGQCPTTSSIVVNVNNNTTVTFAQSDACEDQVTLTATPVPAGSYTYRWFRNGVLIPGGQSIIAGLTDNNQTYQVTIINTLSGCSFSSPASTIFVAGDLQLTMATTIPCTGSPFTLTATASIGGTGLQWAFNGTNIPPPDGTQPSLVRSVGGLYRITGTLPGCSETVEQEVILFPTTPGSLPGQKFICNQPGNPDCTNPVPNSCEFFLDAGADFQSYQWLLGGVILPGETSQTLTVTEPGLYSVNLVNLFGCASTDQTNVVEECKPRINAPTAFRPGSGVLNSGDANYSNSEFWIIPSFIDDTDFQVFIFNRWGEMVFQSNSIAFRWNGGYNNNASQLLPAGTYTYILKYRSAYRPEDGLQETRGGVVLVR